MLLYFEWTPGLLCSHNIFAKEKTRITWSQLDDTWVLSYASHPTCAWWRKAIVQEEDSCDSLRRARETLISGAFIAGFDTKVYEDLRIFYTIKIHLKHILKLLSSNMIIQFPNSDDSTISGPVVAKIGAGWWHLANEYEAADPARKARMRGLEAGIGNHRWYGDMVISWFNGCQLAKYFEASGLLMLWIALIDLYF